MHADEYSETFWRNNPDLRFYVWHKDVVSSDGVATPGQPPALREHLYATEDEVEDAKAWIAAQAGQGPWCVALNFITPHDPFHVPPPGMFRADTITDPENPTVQEMLVAMLESMDHYVADLLNAIDDQLGDTVVVFVGDNGTQDEDRDTDQSVDAVIGDDKSTGSIGGVHVPLIIADGGLMKGGPARYVTTPPRSVPDLVHIIDLYGTAVDIAGGTVAGGESINLAPHLRGVAGAKRAYNFSQMFDLGQPPVANGTIKPSSGVNASVSDGDYKLTCEALLGRNAQGTYLVDEQTPFPIIVTSQGTTKRFDPTGTQWSVAGFDDTGAIGSFHPTPWEFEQGSMQAVGFWSGSYQLMPGTDRTYACEITGGDQLEVFFVSDTRFVARKDGALHRFGKRL